MDIKTLSKVLLLTSMATLMNAPAFADEAHNANSDSTPLTLEEVMNTQIYSASKRPEKISETAASVYVITAEDIAKSGVTSIPEALRMVPGIDVARTNANTWAISIRGFNTQFSNKLLVLIDGRSVYTPLFSGVYWDSQDYVLDDIDRIEVIKGPGGTLWGANAVNGVINIITKEARKTQGSYASETMSTNGDNSTEVRYGGKTSDIDFYRVYGKYTNTDSLPNSVTGANNHDDWSKGQAGFRYDFRNSNYDALTFQGDFFDGKKEYPFALPTGSPPFTSGLLTNSGFQGANMMLKWNILSDKFKTDIKAYTDYTTRNESPVLQQSIETQDIDVQTQYDYGRNSFIGGAEARFISYNLINSQYISYAPSESSVSILSTFLQDKITLVPNKVFLTLGSKFDYNDYTDFGVEPNARLSYQIDEHNSVWAAVSQAIRTPTMGENSFTNLTPPGPPLGVISIVGNPSYGSENLTAYEMGYRGDISKNAFFDISTFYNEYTHLKTGEANSATPPITLLTSNNGYGETYGVESYAVWGVNKYWDVKPGYTFLIQNFHLRPGSNDTTLEHDEERSPQNQFTLGSYVKLAENVNWDSNLYYVGNLHYFTTDAVPVRTRIDAYTRFDTQIRWNVMKDVELSLIGQNLLDDKHQEFNEVIYNTPSQDRRAVLARVKVKF